MKKLNLTFLLGILIAIFLSTGVTSCKESVKENNENSNSFFTVPFAEIVKGQRDVNVSEFAKDMEIIQLENTEDALLGQILEFKLTKDYIFVHHDGGGQVSQFSRDGKFIRDIGIIGKGPGEYSACMIISVDEEEELLYVNGSGSGKMLVYNFEGELTKTIKNAPGMMNVWGRDSLIVGVSELLYGGSEPADLVEYNENGDTVQSVPNYKPFELAELSNFYFWEGYNCFYRTNNVLNMRGWNSDTIYTYNEKGVIEPKFSIDMQKHKFDLSLIYGKGIKKSLSKESFMCGIFESADYVFMPYGHPLDLFAEQPGNPNEGCALYNKKTKEGFATTEGEQTGFIDDITGGPRFRPTFANDSTAVMIVNALDMKMYLDSDQFKNQKVSRTEEKERLIDVNKTLKEEDNCFIVLMKL